MTLTERFYKDGSNDISKLDDFIIYNGEFKESVPDGNGVCTTTDFEFKCRYYKGYLIEIDHLSLLPEYITIGD